MNVRTDLRMDKAQFFNWLEHQERKYELADGRVFVLPYVTRPHSQICTNLILALGARLDPGRLGISRWRVRHRNLRPKRSLCRYSRRTVQ